MRYRNLPYIINSNRGLYVEDEVHVEGCRNKPGQRANKPPPPPQKKKEIHVLDAYQYVRS